MTKPLGELSRELEGGHGGAHTASHAFRLRRDVSTIHRRKVALRLMLD